MTAYEALPTDPEARGPSNAFSFNKFGASFPPSSNTPSTSQGPSRSSRDRVSDIYQPLASRPVRSFLYLASGIVTILFLGSLGHALTKGRIGSYASDTLSTWNGAMDGRELVENEGLLDPTYEVDKVSGLKYPPDVFPAALNPYKRANAVIVSLVRNGELNAMKDSMRHVEERFNRKFGYPWVFMNEVPFTEEFKKGVLSMTRSNVDFVLIPKEHWSYPDYVNQTVAAQERQKMVNENVIYGGSESYRHMCRFNSGFFFQQKALLQYDYYWRVEPGIELFCDIDYDPFLFMQMNKKIYSFTIALYEYRRTIESLWDTVKSFAKEHPQYIAEDNSLKFMVDGGRHLQDSDYNLCHFWSNFEIGDMRFWRSKPYQDFFNYLDKTGNFFYERWGDAPVHSIAAALFLQKDEIHFFSDIAYRHNPYVHCPRNEEKFYANGKCNCPKENSFDQDGYSCMNQWFRVGKNYDP